MIAEDKAISSPYREGYWIYAQSTLCILLVITLCLLTSLSYFSWKFEINRKPKKRLLVYLTILSLVMALGRFVSDEMVAFLGWQSNKMCLHSVSVSYAFYYASAGPVFIVLWIRQDSFYSTPFLRHLVNKKLRYLSWITLALLVVSGLLIATLFEIPSVTGWAFEATPTGCRDATDQQDFEVLPFLLLFFNTIGQVSLLGLLLYPLIASKRKQNTTSSIYKPRNPQSPNPLLRRAVLASFQESQQKGVPAGVDSSSRLDLNPSTSYRKENSVGGIYHVSQNSPVENFSDCSQSDDEVFGQFQSLSQKRFDCNSETDEEVSKACATTDRKKIHPKRPKPKKMTSPTHRGRGTSASSSKQMIDLKKQSLQGHFKSPRRKRRSSELKREMEVSSLIRKVFILAFVCVLSDVLATVIPLTLVLPELASLVIYDINLMINIACIIASFKDWKTMIMPFCRNPTSLSRTMSPTRRESLHTANSSRKSTQRSLPFQQVKYKKDDDMSDNISIRSVSSAGTGSFTWSRANSPEVGMFKPISDNENQL